MKKVVETVGNIQKELEISQFWLWRNCDSVWRVQPLTNYNSLIMYTNSSKHSIRWIFLTALPRPSPSIHVFLHKSACLLHVSVYPQIAIAIGVLTSNKGGGRRTTLADWTWHQGAIAGCSGRGAIAGCQKGGWRPTLGEWTRAIAGCQSLSSFFPSIFRATNFKKTTMNFCFELLADVAVFSSLITQKLFFAIWGPCWYDFFKMVATSGVFRFFPKAWWCLEAVIFCCGLIIEANGRNQKTFFFGCWNFRRAKLRQ